MPGQQDRWDQLDRWDPQDPRDAVIPDLPRLIDRVQRELPYPDGTVRPRAGDRSGRSALYREAEAAVERERASRSGSGPEADPDQPLDEHAAAALVADEDSVTLDGIAAQAGTAGWFTTAGPESTAEHRVARPGAPSNGGRPLEPQATDTQPLKSPTADDRLQNTMPDGQLPSPHKQDLWNTMPDGQLPSPHKQDLSNTMPDGQLPSPHKQDLRPADTLPGEMLPAPTPFARALPSAPAHHAPPAAPRAHSALPAALAARRPLPDAPPAHRALATDAPARHAPLTGRPAKHPPLTDDPADAPLTNRPVLRPLRTDAPTHHAPLTGRPADKASLTEAPAHAPIAEVLTGHALPDDPPGHPPLTDTPGHAPLTDVPALHSPVTDARAERASLTDAPANHARPDNASSHRAVPDAAPAYRAPRADSLGLHPSLTDELAAYALPSDPPADRAQPVSAREQAARPSDPASADALLPRDASPSENLPPEAAPTDGMRQPRPADPGGVRVDQPGVRLVPGSRADLRLRLERLPAGHPSSPYHDDGTRKPQPPRLKHLELAPPGRDRATDAARITSPMPSRAQGNLAHAVTQVPVSRAEPVTHRDNMTRTPATELVPDTTPKPSANDATTRRALFSEHNPHDAPDVPAHDTTIARHATGEPRRYTAPGPPADADGTAAPATDGARPHFPVASPADTTMARAATDEARPHFPPGPADNDTTTARTAAEEADRNGMPAPPAYDSGLASAAQDSGPASAAQDSADAAGNRASHSIPASLERTTDHISRDSLPSPPAYDTSVAPRYDSGTPPAGQPSQPSRYSWDSTTAQVTPDSAAGPSPDHARSRPNGERARAAASADRSEGVTERAGPHVDANGSWSWGLASLTADQARVARSMHDRFRAAEGRNLFGSYANGGLTEALRGIEARLEHGRLATDADLPALISPDLFMAEVAGMLMRYPGAPVEDLCRHVTGALAYAFVFDENHYTVGTWLVHDALRVQGFRLDARRNGWHATEHKYMVTSWLDPSLEIPFQLQFHTAASLEARQLARASAGVLADPRTPMEKAAGLRSEVTAAWAAVAAPPGISQIGDYRRNDRLPTHG